MMGIFILYNMVKLNRVGEKYLTKEGYKVTIISYKGKKNCDIQFENSVTLENIEYCQIQRGNIKNPYHPSVCGVGYVGVGDNPTSSDGKQTKAYKIWKGMIERCYRAVDRHRYVAYNDCLVDEGWHNFQNFAEWFKEKYKENYQLDKDILLRGNRVYSAKTCCFVPQEINSLLINQDSKRGIYPIGVSKRGAKFQAKINKNGIQEYLGWFDTPELAFQAYKTAKECYIKEMAKLCKNIICREAYQALINYKVFHFFLAQ